MYIGRELEALADEKYRDFTSALIPNIPKKRVIGVRLPEIRALAKRILKESGGSLPKLEYGTALEEKLLHGFVISGAKLPLEEQLKAVADFVPEIDCWSVCDSFVTSLKFFKKNQERVWEFLQPYFASDEPYYIRFAVVSTLAHFSQAEYAQRAFEKFDAVSNDDYYVKMAIAWAVSVFFIHAPEKTWDYLYDNSLDNFTFNKALQKITESYRVSAEDKEIIRSMKRK